MNNPFVPTPEQLTAINNNSNMVITACPGSGKTSVIVEKMRKDITEVSSHKGVIGITFTVKASNELKNKCKKGGFNTKYSFFGTIDHFCLSEIIFPFINRLWGVNKLKLECIKYIDLEHELKVNLPVLSEPNVVLTTEDFCTYKEEFIKHYRIGFILLEAVGILANYIINNSSSCKRYLYSRYTSVYVDEYQDSSEPQHRLFLTLLSLNLKAVAVGDLQQSIYAFRGSRTDYINDLISQDDIFDHHVININHRCHPSIINYANRLFEENSILLPTDQIRVFQKKFNGNQIELAADLNTFIPYISDFFGVSKFSDIAILVRKNNSLGYLSNGLNIPHRVYIDDSLRLINTQASNLFSDLLKYRHDLAFLINDIDALRVYENKSTVAHLKEIRSEIKLLRTVNKEKLEESILSIALGLLEKNISAKDITALNKVINSNEALNHYLPKNNNEVQVMTLHKSKGLEFEIVVHLDLYEWIFPYRQFTGNYNEKIYPDWDQDLNLHYVGITRAKTACILAFSSRRLNFKNEDKKGQPSEFLNLSGLENLFN